MKYMGICFLQHTGQKVKNAVISLLVKLHWHIYHLNILGPLLTLINSNPSMDYSKYSLYNMWMKLLIHSQTSTAQPLKFQKG